MPEDVQRILSAHYECESYRDVRDWREWAVRKIVQRADTSTARHSSAGPRAVCPLCRESSRNRYVEGFALPVGLERHLTGYGQSYQCGVFRAADQEALEAQWSRDRGEPQLVREPGARTKPAWEANDTTPTAAVLLFQPRLAPE